MDIEKKPAAEAAATSEDGDMVGSVTSVSGLTRDDAGFQRSLNRRQIMMMSFGILGHNY